MLPRRARQGEPPLDRPQPARSSTPPPVAPRTPVRRWGGRAPGAGAPRRGV